MAISDEDKALFRRVVGNVLPLKSRKNIPTSALAAPKMPGIVLAKKEPRTHKPIYLSDHYTDTKDADSQLCYQSAHCPAKRFKALKQGLIRYGARLDLHGLNRAQAQEKLLHFLQQARVCQWRCLLIIHGKGQQHSPVPVLKNLVNHWLPQIPTVLAFHSAKAQDGGTGAVYVLLKRNPSSSTKSD
ncbi:MAG TPA: DNA mismatch repair protein MutS [Legionellales bacterium]|mgnify:CR=1 FL=1|nr:DNA mismatch repair protein MutS [Legionellales bacterium]HCA90130.1 DNA mismatch repair protein MutS [Legionellales bacterium]|tara:strand:- start:2024 stop:2581 length:558 start_codon:yes stop_codon:yes gene_type:complete